MYFLCNIYGYPTTKKENDMSYDAYLDRCHDEWFNQEDEYCSDCGHMECVCDDDCGDMDDFDADDYEVCFDHETGSLEVVR